MDPLSDILSLLKPKSYAFRGVDASGDWALSFVGAEGTKCFALHSVNVCSNIRTGLGRCGSWPAT